MSESSSALSRASKGGVENIASSFATAARNRMPVYPRRFSAKELWVMAGIEGAEHNPAVLGNAISTVTGQSTRVCLWIAIASLLLVFAVRRAVKPARVAFQCANCGELTCNRCCHDERGSVVCQSCNEAVANVTSDRVIEALLRQRRQSVVVKRRRAIRWMTVWIPGLRHIYFGRFASGFVLSALFSFSALMLWTRGYPLPRWDTLVTGTPLWQWLLPAAGVFVSYWVAIVSRQRYEVRNTRAGSSRSRSTDVADEAASMG
jgi:hypothetical protein